MQRNESGRYRLGRLLEGIRRRHLEESSVTLMIDRVNDERTERQLQSIERDRRAGALKQGKSEAGIQRIVTRVAARSVISKVINREG